MNVRVMFSDVKSIGGNACSGPRGGSVNQWQDARKSNEEWLVGPSRSKLNTGQPIKSEKACEKLTRENEVICQGQWGRFPELHRNHRSHQCRMGERRPERQEVLQLQWLV